MSKKTILLVSLGVIAAGAANAELYEFSLEPQIGGGSNYGYNPAGGEINSINSTFDSVSQQLTWEVNYDDTPDGFWLVLGDGPNPKGHSGQLAAFFFDGRGSSGGPKLTVYGYNGVNGSTSWFDGSNAGGTQAPDRIASSVADSSWVNSLTFTNNGDGTRTMGFDIDATAINAHSPMYPGSTPWEGAQFGENIGVWFHTVDGLNTRYNSSGFLKQFDYSKQGWVDGENFETVPEPGTMVALAGLGALLLKRKKKSSK